MGEYAMYDGKRIKIGTCEEMNNLRAEDAPKVEQVPKSLHPVEDHEGIRFRFPFPDEDGIEPGAYPLYDRKHNVYGVPVPDGVTHRAVRLTSGGDNRYSLSIPCPEGTEQGPVVVKSRFQSALSITHQRVWEGRLVLVAECNGCGTAFRLPTADDVAPILTAMLDEAEKISTGFDADEDRARALAVIVQRVIAGYENPPEWVKATAPAPAPEQAEDLVPALF